jgi:hypothetical protein
MRSTWLLAAFTILVACGAFGVAAGCSSTSNSGQPVTTDGGDASTADSLAEGAVDAGPDNEQDPDVYPSQHHPIPQLTYNGGPILSHIRVVTITFTGDAHRDGFRGFTHFITGTDWWKQTSGGYCVDGGPNAGCVGTGTEVAPEGGAWLPDGSTADGGDGYLDVELAYDFAGKGITDSDIQTWLSNHLAAGDFPAGDSQTVYTIFFPSTTSISTGGAGGTSCVSFLGYHSEAAITVQPGLVSYAVIPYCSMNGLYQLTDYQWVTLAASHELSEAATDPHPNTATAFYLSNNDAWIANAIGGGGEDGDMCMHVTYDLGQTYNESGYNVQRVWSNQAAGASQQPCQPWTPTYHAAALRTTTQKIPPDNHLSDGYVFVKAGTSVDVVADIFSAAALPHDLQLYAGKFKYGATDPSDMDPPDQGITVTFSGTQVHNGNGITVTFTVPKIAVPGDYLVLLRTVLEKNDFNDWPVLVHVQ